MRPELRTPRDTQVLGQPASAERPGAQKSAPQSSETTDRPQGVPLDHHKSGESYTNPARKLASKPRDQQMLTLLATRRLARRVMMQGGDASQSRPQGEPEGWPIPN